MFELYSLINPMIAIFPSILLFLICIILFIREGKLDHERFLEKDRLADEHILKEVERFKKQMELQANYRKSLLNVQQKID